MYFQHALSLPGFILTGGSIMNSAAKYRVSPPLPLLDSIPVLASMPKLWLFLLGNVLTQYPFLLDILYGVWVFVFVKGCHNEVWRWWWSEEVVLESPFCVDGCSTSSSWQNMLGKGYYSVFFSFLLNHGNHCSSFFYSVDIHTVINPFQNCYECFQVWKN